MRTNRFKIILSLFIYISFLYSCSSIKSLSSLDKKVSNESVHIPEINSALQKKFTVQSLRPVTRKKIKKRKNVKTLKKTVTKSTSVKKVIPNEKKVSKIELASRKLWEQFDNSFIKENEEFLMNVKFIGVPAGSLYIQTRPVVEIAGKASYHFYARAKTANYYSWIYEVDDIVESFVNMNTFLSVKYNLSQKETKKTVNHVELYDRDKLKTYFRYQKIKDGKKSLLKIDNDIPLYSHDFMSCFFFLRGLPLKKNDIYLIPTTTKSKTWTLKAQVVAIETINNDKLGKLKAAKLKISTKYDGKIAKGGNMFLWISVDRNKKILRFESGSKIGTISGELVDYKI